MDLSRWERNERISSTNIPTTRIAATDYQIGVWLGVQEGREKNGNGRKKRAPWRRWIGSNDKWRPQDCASDIQLTRPSPPPFSHTSLLASFPYDVRCRARTRPHVDRSRSVCLLLTFNQQSPNYCSARVRTSDVIAIFCLILPVCAGRGEDRGKADLRGFVFLFYFILFFFLKYIYINRYVFRNQFLITRFFDILLYYYIVRTNWIDPVIRTCRTTFIYACF